jgi:hypothetical protein
MGKHYYDRRLRKPFRLLDADETTIIVDLISRLEALREDLQPRSV